MYHHAFTINECSSLLINVSYDHTTHTIPHCHIHTFIPFSVNVVYKIAPFYPDLYNFNTNTSLTDKDLQNLRTWGFNVIRLYLSWEGTEPKRGQYDTNYLAILKGIIRQCEKYGIMVILDVHQDVMSDLFCGEGKMRM